MASRSAEIGLASIISGFTGPPNRAAWLDGMKEKVTASTMPRDASARLASGTRRCAGVRAGCGMVVSRGSGSTGILS